MRGLDTKGRAMPSRFYRLIGLAVLIALLPAARALAVDSDGDGIADQNDNCKLKINVAPFAQVDADGDGYGNACDGDFDNDGLVTVADFDIFRTCFQGGSPSADPLCTKSDMDGNGAVNSTDFGQLFVPQYQAGVPGPSGLACAGTSNPCVDLHSTYFDADADGIANGNDNCVLAKNPTVDGVTQIDADFDGI